MTFWLDTGSQQFSYSLFSSWLLRQSYFYAFVALDSSFTERNNEMVIEDDENCKTQEVFWTNDKTVGNTKVFKYYGRMISKSTLCNVI